MRSSLDLLSNGSQWSFNCDVLWLALQRDGVLYTQVKMLGEASLFSRLWAMFFFVARHSEPQIFLWCQLHMEKCEFNILQRIKSWHTHALNSSLPAQWLEAPPLEYITSFFITPICNMSSMTPTFNRTSLTLQLALPVQWVNLVQCVYCFGVPVHLSQCVMTFTSIFYFLTFPYLPDLILVWFKYFSFFMIFFPPLVFKATFTLQGLILNSDF